MFRKMEDNKFLVTIIFISLNQNTLYIVSVLQSLNNNVRHKSPLKRDTAYPYQKIRKH